MNIVNLQDLYFDIDPDNRKLTLRPNRTNERFKFSSLNNMNRNTVKVHYSSPDNSHTALIGYVVDLRIFITVSFINEGSNRSHDWLRNSKEFERFNAKYRDVVTDLNKDLLIGLLTDLAISILNIDIEALMAANKHLEDIVNSCISDSIGKSVKKAL